MGGLLQRGRVRVALGAAERRPEPGAAVPLVMLGILPEGTRSPGEGAPACRVRAPRPGRDGITVEQLRFSGREDLRVLPGLDARLPSRLRDAVALAARAGAAFVEVLLVQVPGLLPWEFHRAEVLEALSGSLDGLAGAVVTVPDLAGPPVTGPTDPIATETRTALQRANLAALAPGWRGRHQLGLVDDLDPVTHLPSMDALLCTWSGSDPALARHGWRSAAAVVAGVLARPDHPMTHGVDGLSVDLPAGRRQPTDRRAALGLHTQRRARPDAEQGIVLRLEQDVAHLEGDETLRHPLGTWPLPALRTASILHLRLLRAAEAFVFRPVQPIHAFALGLALEQVVRPLVEAGVLVGPDGRGAPSVRADIAHDPRAPGLVADIAAQLRPWCRTVHIRVAVQAEGASAEMAA